ncbi:MAG TPA: hypothetical protein VJI67_00995 [archaeon]|nr:hypothetical protein [archaeon]HLD80500.1 hypothetical protein [archaeon]
MIPVKIAPTFKYYEYYKGNAKFKEVYNSILRGIEKVRQDPKRGEEIAKKLIPKHYVEHF